MKIEDCKKCLFHSECKGDRVMCSLNNEMTAMAVEKCDLDNSLKVIGCPKE